MLNRSSRRHPQLVVPYLLAAICVATAGHAAPATEGQEWASFRGPNVDGISTESRIFSTIAPVGLKIAWKTRIGSGYSSVAVAGGKAVTMYADGESDVMAAFDAASGRRLWDYAYALTYTGQYDDEFHPGPIATPLIADGRVFGLGRRGQLFAVDAASGQQIWTTHLAADHGIVAPAYGFGASPILVDGVLIIELGGDGTAVAGFDPASGERLWTAGNDGVDYQVPVPMTLAGRRQVVAAGSTKLFGLDAKSGELLWQWEHGGSGRLGADSMTPVAAGDDRIFLTHLNDGSQLVALAAAAGKVTLDTVWEGHSIRNSYNVPVYYQGHLYAFSSRFLTCVDAATGESRWRSRQPGDGFLIAVDGRLVITTKKGSVHVVEATPEGYREVAGLAVFEDAAWTPPSFAGGSIYVRSMGEIARLDLSVEAAQPRSETASRDLPSSPFGQFLAAVGAAADGEKKALVDRFLASRESFPIIEGDHRVHFVYRGAATDVAVAGDIFGTRQEQAMIRVPGTDLFYYSAELASDARVDYLFITDYQEILDPLNPRQMAITTLGRDMELAYSGDGLPMSWFAMPDWSAPAHLEPAPAASRGRLERRVLKTPQQSEIALDVYLPHGYDDSERRFPVAYVHNGREALEHGRLPNSLDNLIGRSVEPLIVVFVDIFEDDPDYERLFVGSVVPFVDASYRTVAAPAARANVGVNYAATWALEITLGHRDLFAKAAVQSLRLLLYFPEIESREDLGELVLYMDWGTYDLRNPLENWDIAAANRKLAQKLREKGVRLAGGEVHDGSGWPSWRTRTDRVFAAIFPLR